MKNKKPNIFRSLGIGFAVVLALVVYAYGFQVTKVDLAETKSGHRQQQLFRILRAIAKPDLFEFEKEEVVVSLPIMIPCPEGGFTPEEPDKSRPYVVMTPACADPLAQTIVEGYNFEPFSSGPLNLRPADSDVNLQLGTIETDENGYFKLEVRLSNRPNDKIQELHAITRRNVGTPTLTRTAHETWEKIVETVFLALLATTIGTALAILLSFFAARNLMQNVTSSLMSMSLSILLIPLGIVAGAFAADWVSQVSAMLTTNIFLSSGVLVISPAIIWLGIRWALPQQELRRPSLGLRIARIAVLFGLALVSILILYLLSFLMLTWGSKLGGSLGNFGFLGYFIRDLGDILNMVVKVLVALAGAGLFSSLAGRWGETLSRQKGVLVRIIHTVLAIVAGAVLSLLIAATIYWFYQFRNTFSYFTGAAIVGGVSGLVASLYYKPGDPVPTDMVIYYVSRTIFNALRSLDPLIMVIVFVVWVGIGPFAGSLALALHTVVALAKLYSEQVESIMAGLRRS